jgi:hypothetical protein
MASPFPGMDPYLERFWRDVHASLITYARDQLQDRLPTDLIARIEERETGVVLFPQDEPITETYLEIIEARSGHRVITAIEFQSPTNKTPGPGQELYLRKERELRQAHVSLIEIDLVRSGRRTLAGSPYAVPEPERTAYIACVRRGWVPERLEYYRLPLRERLKAIRIPLRQTDVDVPLELQALVDQAYHHGRYELELNYRQPPEPPLDAEDAAWADELLRRRGLR